MRQLLLLPLCAVILLIVSASAVLSRDARGTPQPAQSVSTGRRPVLVLDSYQYGLPVPDSVNRGIRIALTEGGVSSSDIFIEHLDLSRMSGRRNWADIATLLRDKLAEKDFGIIIVEGNLAIDLLAREAKGLFPHAVLFTLMTPSLAPLKGDTRKVIDIPWRVDPAGTLRIALDLFPRTRRVVVVTGASDDIVPFLDDAQKAFAPWKDKLEFEYTNQMTYDEMLQRISKLPSDAIIIYSPYFNDTSGRSFVPAAVAATVGKLASVPVFGTLSAFLGQGIVGGSLLETEEMGQQAGKIALDYLDGRLKPVAPVTTFAPASAMRFDWRELVRWKADISNLPGGSVVINRPPTLWGQYKAEVAVVAVVFLALTVLAGTLLILNRRLKSITLRLEQEIEERKEAETQLQQAKQDWEDTFNIIPDSITIHDKNFNIIQANTAAVNILGLPGIRPINAKCYRYYHGLDSVPQNCPSSEHFATAKSGVREVFEPNLQMFLEIRVMPRLDDQGNVVGLIHICRDITNRKKLEESIEERKRFAETVIEDSAIATFVLGADHRVLFWNKACENLTGTPAAGAVGTDDHWRAFYDDKRPCLADLVIDGASDKMPQLYHICSPSPLVAEGLHAEGWYRNLGGKDRYILFDASPIRNKKGEIVAAIETLQDITERKCAEDALKESQGFLTTLLDSIPVPVFYKDVEERYLGANKGFEEFFGKTREQLIGKNVFDFSSRELAEVHHAKDAELLRNPGVQICDALVEDAHGTLHDVVIHKATFMEPGGRIQGLIGVMLDVTERTKAEKQKDELQAQLQQSQKMESVGRLAGGVAHDFNNMLGVILGHAELAMMRCNPSEQTRAHLRVIQDSARRSAELTRQLLAFARKQTVVPKVLDLNDSVSGMLKILMRLIGEDIHIGWLPGRDLWSVKMDPAQVDQILANLCVNARDAIEGVGRVTIETEDVAFDEEYCAVHPGFIPGDYVMLAVSDDGCGMDKGSMEHLFEPFFTTKAAGKGTGLGLATVYGIVRQNEGFINVYSEPGEGATFKIYLPRFEGEAAESNDQRVAEIPKGHGETIILVEDEPAILDMCRSMLVDFGYTVLTAATPGEALRQAVIHAGKIQLLITDVVMPEMSGRDLEKQIGDITPGLKCLFISGYTADVIAHRGVLDEGVNFLSKPFSARDLATKVREVLDA